MDRKENPYFFSDAYHTPDSIRRHLLDRLSLGSRAWFSIRFIGLVFRNRRAALSGNYGPEVWAAYSHEVMQHVEACGGKLHITGLDNIRNAEPPVVFISNHMSTLETMVFPCIIVPYMDTTFVVKESLVRHFLFGPIMRSRDPIVVGRADPRQDLQQVMEQGQLILSSGKSVVIFPQSTRSTAFHPSRFNSLGIKLARAAGVSVIPVAVRTDFWGNGRLVKDLGPVNRKYPIYMDFGEPFRVQGTGRDEHNRVVSFISERLERWYADPGGI